MSCSGIGNKLLTMNNDILVSICIPAYEMHNKGYEFLDFSFSKIYEQTYKRIEVIVSDQSNDYSIMRACSKWSDKLHIKYFKDDNRGKSSMNINNALSNAKGELVKILFQDDFLFRNDSIEITVNEHKKTNKDWYVSSFTHIENGNFTNVITPKYNENIYAGENTIGSPSVITYKNKKDFIKFENDLVWLMDCDYYKRLFNRYGHPHVINDVTVAVRIWQNSYSFLIDDSVKEVEKQYVYSKYGKLNENKTHTQTPIPIPPVSNNTNIDRCRFCGEPKNKIKYNFCQRCNKIY